MLDRIPPYLMALKTLFITWPVEGGILESYVIFYLSCKKVF